MIATRKRIRVLILATIIAAGAVGVGFALSPESKGIALSRESNAPAVAAHSALAVVRSTAIPLSPVASLPQLPDAAKLFGLGTLLIALAAVVRRAV